LASIEESPENPWVKYVFECPTNQTIQSGQSEGINLANMIHKLLKKGRGFCIAWEIQCLQAKLKTITFDYCLNTMKLRPMLRSSDCRAADLFLLD
jgi:hypothetical protein